MHQTLRVYHLQTVVVFGKAFTGILARGTQDLKEDLITVESVLKVLGLTKTVEAPNNDSDTIQTVTVTIPNTGGFRDVPVVPRRTVRGLLEYSERLNDDTTGQVTVFAETVIRA